MTTNEIIKDIKAQFRLFMNGAVSQSMREKGIDYKLNFGIELPRLREISAGYGKNHSLAQALWKENIRECKILATMIQPVETFLPEIADIWIEDIRHQEIAELAVMNLFQHLPYASSKAFCWMADEREFFQVCGYLIMARFFMRGIQLGERAEDEFMDQAVSALAEYPSSQRPAHAALTALMAYRRMGREQAKRVSKSVQSLHGGSNETLSLMIDRLIEE